uniref:Uncharacterized protein n=1 Tax=Rhizophora mucronata TaxID=61149 RepID=A0A2P2NU77_RHIMU
MLGEMSKFLFDIQRKFFLSLMLVALLLCLFLYPHFLLGLSIVSTLC